MSDNLRGICTQEFDNKQRTENVVFAETLFDYLWLYNHKFNCVTA